MGSLFDQLKQAGLVDEKKAKKVKQENYQNKKKQKGKKHQSLTPDATKQAAQQAQAEKAKRDRELNQQRQQEQAAKAEAAAVRQLISENRLKEYEGDQVYHFTDGTKIKSLYLNSETHRQLSEGRLRIARDQHRYALLSQTVAQRVAQRDPEAIIPIAKAEQPQQEDDYYAQFEVPDDLSW